MTAEQEILQWLTSLRDNATNNLRILKPDSKPVYAGTGDFLLQHGQWFTPRPLPPEYKRGEMRACFANAAGAAVRYGLRYIEGYSVMVIAQHHAWCADDKGVVYEFTWPELGAAYFGTEFNPLRVLGGAVLGNERDTSIYMKKFKPEGRPR